MKVIRDFFTRHLIIAPISFGSLLFFILGIGINVFAATGLFIAIYLGGSFTIKQVQTNAILKNLGMSRSELNYIKGQLHGAKLKLKRLNGYYGKVRSISAFRQLHEMNMLSRRILKIVQEEPQRFYDVENFFYAHLDSAVELTSQYATLVNQPLKDKEIRIALQNTRETLSDVNEQLEDDLKRALSSDMAKLQIELDFVDATIKKNKPLLEVKGDHNYDRK